MAVPKLRLPFFLNSKQTHNTVPQRKMHTKENVQESNWTLPDCGQTSGKAEERFFERYDASHTLIHI